MKMIIDVHTHTNFSPDSDAPIESMLETAHQKGLVFYGLSDHFEYDHESPFNPSPEKEAAYFHQARHLQEDYEGSMNVLVGAEFGYSTKPSAQERAMRTCEKYHLDFVVNSVHDLDGEDYYFKRVFVNKDKPETYGDYLRFVRQSLDVPYHYDIVGHIGYHTRYAPYADRRMYVEEFQAEIDDILQTIIKKDKILEINSSNKGGVEAFLPERKLLERYFALGGRKVSFGSDAHDPSRIAENYEKACAMAKEIGFTHFTVPCKGEHIKIEL
ncbi:MAG: histidinol-phosphatase HisJ family protein [Clostridia bacterium]|nr:histidinol-phosphatase HisJ family protein [Clostridia bacterium]